MPENAHPAQIDIVGNFLAIRWRDSTESIIPLDVLRKACPCAMCCGEPDGVSGRVLRPAARPLTDEAFILKQLELVGAYALRAKWADGHETGIYPLDSLRNLPEFPAGS
jgi:DUF971 family protein